MNRSTLLIIFVLIPAITWGDGEILSSQHKSVEDFHSAWGKGFDHQSSKLPSNKTIPGNPQSTVSENNGTTIYIEKLPAHESHTQIVVAQGYAWCGVKRNGTWQLMQAPLDNQTSDWKNISGDLPQQVMDMKLNQDGDLSLLLSDEEQSKFHQQSILIHSGGTQVTQIDPAPLAGNMDAARQQWEKHCGNEPLLMNEFDLKTEGEFLALTHSIRDSALTVRYRISPALGQPFSIWSAPVPAGSLQIKKDGRFLQYQVIAGEDKTITSVPNVSLTYTHLDSPPRKQEEALSKAIPSSFSDDTNQNSSGPDPDINDNERNSNSDQPTPNSDSQEENQPENDNSQSPMSDGNTTENEHTPTQNNLPSEVKENSNIPNQGEQQNGQEETGTVEEAAQNVEEQTEINPQDKSEDNSGENSNPQQEQNQEQNDSPTQSPPTPIEPESQPNESEPEFTSPFNHLIGQPNQQPNQEPPTQDSQPPSQDQPNSNNPEQHENNPQNNSSDSANDPEQPDESAPHTSNENGNNANNSSDAQANHPSPNQQGTPTQPDTSGSANPTGDSSGAPTSGDGTPNQGNGNPPPSGMPQSEGNAAGFPMPSMPNDSDGSSYKPQQSSQNGNQSRTSRSSGLSKPNERNIASPTIGAMTPAVSPAISRISFVDEIDDEETTRNPVLPIASSAGLLTVLFWIRGKKRKSKVDVNPSEHEAQSSDLIQESLDEFTCGEKLLYTLIPKHEDSVWETAIAFDPTVLAAEINRDQILTLHEDGNIRLEKSSNTTPEVLSLGTWQKQGITPQIMSAGLPFFALGLNIKGQINICQGKQSEKSFLEEQKPMNVPTSLHSIQNAMIKHNKLWVIGEQFNQSIALCAAIEHGKVKKWKRVIPQDAPAGEIKGMSTSGRDLIAYAADGEPEVIRIYQRDTIRGGWELIAKSSYSGGRVALSMNEKRCFMVEWFEDNSPISIHAFTRNDDGRFTGHYVNQVDLPYEAEIKSAAFQYGKLILQGKQTTPKGDTRIVSCSASVRKLLAVTTTV